MPLKHLFSLTAMIVALTAIAMFTVGKALATAVIFIAAFAIAAKNFTRLGKLIAVGRGESLLDRMGERIEAVVAYIFGERKLLEDFNAGWMHLCFLYGFIVLSVGHFELVIRALTTDVVHEGIGFHLLKDAGDFGNLVYQIFLLSQDIAAILIIPVSILALLRRWVYKPERLRPRSQDAENILWFIVALYLTFFLLNGAEVALGSDHGWFRLFSAYSAHALFGLVDLETGLRGASVLFGEVSVETIKLWLEIGYWSHLFIFLAFLNYLPYSKHLHLIAAFPNIYLRRFVPRGQPDTIDFENSEEFGKNRIEQFSFKTLLDSFACTECARCDDVCPANLTNKPLKPKKVVHDLKANLFQNEKTLVPWKADWRAKKKAGDENLPEAPDERPTQLLTGEEIAKEKVGHRGKYPTDGQVHGDEIWSCTTCAACAEVCPVLIESVPTTLIELRRHLVMMESDFPQELTQSFKGLEVQCNPWAIGADTREEWCEGLDVPKMRDQDGREVDYLFWVGCAGATDDRAKKIQRAFAKIMNAAGVDYAILGKEEKCNGDPARRSGNEYVYFSLVEENRAIFEKYKFKKVVTTCPHCLNALKVDYRQFGIELDVIHHSQMILELMDQQRIQIKSSDETRRFTFHDPCYLGRYMGEYDAPREVLNKLGQVDLVEMQRNRNKSFCCGAGGGRMWMEEHLGDRVNNNRTEQAMATGAKDICVACPFCMTMLEDGTKALNVEEQVHVHDLAELVERHMADSGQQ